MNKNRTYTVRRCPQGEAGAKNPAARFPRRSKFLARLGGLRLALIGGLLLALSLSASPAAARYDCDPFEGGSPQSSKKCPCSDEPNSVYYCASAVQYAVFEVSEKLRGVFLSALETAAGVLWLAARFIANLAEALLRGQVWQTVRQGILEQLQAVMGGRDGVLARVTGGGNGLFLLALLLSGLAMAFPLLGASRLVQPDRALLWGVVLLALFISGTQGFDLTSAIENLRVQMIETIAEGEEPAGLIDLVAAPVSATPEEAHLLDTANLLVLPQIMRQSHFIGLPEGNRCRGEGSGADECQKYRVIAFETNLAGQDLEYMFTAVKYQPGVIAGRQKQYTSGLVRMLVAFLAAVVLLLFGIIFALLTAASLVLIIFFFAMLPLGFFEFGGTVLSGLIRQYTGVVGLSLFIAVMVRLMGGVTGAIFGTVSDFSDALGLLTYLGMLLIVGLGLQMAVRSAWGLVDGAFTVLRSSVQAVGALAFAAGGGPLGRFLPVARGTARAATSAAFNTALAAGAGLAAAGPGAALAAGAGGLLSRTRVGRQIAEAAGTAAPASLGAQLFAAAVGAPGGWRTAMGVAAVSDRAREAAAGRLRAGLRLESARLDPHWQAVDRGAYLTPDLNLLESAEQAYFQRRDPRQARQSLAQALGSRALADEVLGAYEIQGRSGARQVRRVVEATQAAADDLERRGRALFDERGGLTPASEAIILSSLRQAGLYRPQEAHQSAFVGRLAGAALRRPVDVWQDPQAARKLAQDTFDPAGVEVQVEDVPAERQLQAVARQLGWGEAQLGQAFAALPAARQRAASSGRPLADELRQAWQQQGTLGDPTDPGGLNRAAQLVILVGAAARVQQHHPLPGERADLQPPLAALREGEDSLVITAPYSADLAGQFAVNFAAQDYFWNLDQAAWYVIPPRAATARQIFARVAANHGWRVVADSQADGRQPEAGRGEAAMAAGERVPAQPVPPAEAGPLVPTAAQAGEGQACPAAESDDPPASRPAAEAAAGPSEPGPTPLAPAAAPPRPHRDLLATHAQGIGRPAIPPAQDQPARVPDPAQNREGR